MAVDAREQSSANLYRELVARKLPAAAGRCAIRTARKRLSYGSLDRAIRQVRLHLAHSGVTAGDRVLLTFSNSSELIVATLAVTAEGAIAVLLDPRSSTRRTQSVVELTSPTLGLAAEATGGEPLRTIQVRLDGRSGAVSPTPEPNAGIAVAPAALDPEAPAVILFSSGSTGHPKGVVLTHGALAWSARSLSRLFELGSDHRELVLSPLNHSGAFQRALATLAVGGEIDLFEDRLTVAHLLAASAELATTGFYTPPHLVRYLLNANAAQVREGLSTLRCLEIGSAGIAREELAGLLELLPEADVFVHYGLTECSRATVLRARDRPDKLDTVGPARSGVDVKIVDDQQRRLGAGETGRIFVRGPQMAHCYWGQPDLTAETWVEGWLATGDHGAIDEEGFLTYHGRHDDLINCAGYTFFPAEVEMELGALPGVREYLVARRVDSRGILGDMPVIVAVPEHPGSFDSPSVLASARATLPPHMVPREVRVVSSLPRTASGKPDRRRVEELVASSADRPDGPSQAS